MKSIKCITGARSVGASSVSTNEGVVVCSRAGIPSTFTNMGIMNSASLLINLEATWYSGSKMDWSAGINTPVVGYNTRFPYSGTVSQPNQTLFEAFFDGGTQLVSFGDYQQVNANLEWRYQLSYDVGIGLNYAFTWQQYLIPVPFRSYSQRIGATVDMTF